MMHRPISALFSCSMQIKQRRVFKKNEVEYMYVQIILKNASILKDHYDRFSSVWDKKKVKKM